MFESLRFGGELVGPAGREGRGASRRHHRFWELGRVGGGERHHRRRRVAGPMRAAAARPTAVCGSTSIPGLVEGGEDGAGGLGFADRRAGEELADRGEAPAAGRARPGAKA